MAFISGKMCKYLLYFYLHYPQLFLVVTGMYSRLDANHENMFLGSQSKKLAVKDTTCQFLAIC